jgi:hypothetical protein
LAPALQKQENAYAPMEVRSTEEQEHEANERGLPASSISIKAVLGTLKEIKT